jgi:hypothetical protein
VRLASLTLLLLSACSGDRCFTVMSNTMAYPAWQVDGMTLVGACWEECRPIDYQVRICMEVSGKPARTLPGG